MHTAQQDFIAIPTFNRVSHLVACLASLRQLRGIERYRIFIRDDCSSQFGAAEIALMIPQAERINRNTTNLGPDANHLRLFEDCLDAGARRILVLDSDMIVSPFLLDFLERTFDRTDGFLGLYNSTLHQERGPIDGELIEKHSVGGAATCWEADAIRSVIKKCGREMTLTWDHSAVPVLRETGRRIIVSKRSYAQHLGLVGSHNRYLGNIDYGKGFVIETDDQARFMAQIFDRMMTRQADFIAPKVKRKRSSRLFGIARGARN